MNPGERGSTTLIAASVAAALVALTLIVFDVTGDVLDRHRAQVSADLAAVAAATALWFGDDACPVASRTVARNVGGELRNCRIAGADVIVDVAVGDAIARARAGPL
ncbi:flp pilus-assembly TadE/G-like family protein [Corynebacterium sp. CCM 9185]|uniref:Rv3654c family TadE-like protein n=1 Tax=Corynebacterium marambiense TaxID=2765364 RepID=UPI0020058C4B|nr:Rv3654c family TadE-like protein [Corynebacterium marambiense]MCK7662448.1 flp pilus-assembly TadE/G-like family protein [Corynebacterium marambiense]MCX7541735.1 flp pilus-assembly TadE/G-like family protein [Corynebacterium marambiense]